SFVRNNGIVLVDVLGLVSNDTEIPEGHRKKTPSKREKHEKADERRRRDGKGEKADERRTGRRRGGGGGSRRCIGIWGIIIDCINEELDRNQGFYWITVPVYDDCGNITGYKRVRINIHDGV